jgi:hypothetical protein
MPRNKKPKIPRRMSCETMESIDLLNNVKVRKNDLYKVMHATNTHLTIKKKNLKL